MVGVDKVDGFVIFHLSRQAFLQRVIAMENCEPRVYFRLRLIQHRRQWNPGPFRDARPPLHTVMPGDLGLRRHRFQRRQRDIQRLFHQPRNCQTIRGKSGIPQAHILCPVRINRPVRPLPLPDIAFRIFRGQAMPAPQKPLRPVGQPACRFKHGPQTTAVIRPVQHLAARHSKCRGTQQQPTSIKHLRLPCQHQPGTSPL